MPIRFLTLLVLSSIALVPSAARSQQAAADDTLRGAIPTVEAARVGASLAGTSGSSDATTAARRREKLPLIFYGALTASAGAVALLHVDPDSGGYRDGWTTATDFPDKAIHALAAWAITTVGVDLGARPRHAALAVCAAGTAFEFAQGYASPYDIAADCVGASGAALWQSWRARRRARAAAAKAATAATAATAVMTKHADAASRARPASSAERSTAPPSATP